MEYLFLRRKRTTAASQRQKTLLLQAAERQWKEKFSSTEVEGRKVDCDLYKGILYHLEIRQVFLDTSLSLKKMSEMLETNQTYLSNVVNRYFGCNLKGLLNTYRVEYAKELLRSSRCSLEEVPQRSGFASKSAFYAVFTKMVKMPPLRYQAKERKEDRLKANILNHSN